MERVLDVYKRPYNANYPVICMDESPKQLIEEGRPSLPIKPGQEARVDYEYVRNGVVNIFMANEPLQGKRFVTVTEFKTKKDWAMFIKRCRRASLLLVATAISTTPHGDGLQPPNGAAASAWPLIVQQRR